MDRRYFYGVLWAMGLWGILLSGFLIFLISIFGRIRLYYDYIDLGGLLISFFISLFLMYRFREGRIKDG